MYALFETFKLLLDTNAGIIVPSVSCTVKCMLDTEFRNAWSENVFKADCLKPSEFFLVSNIYYFFSFCYLNYSNVFLLSLLVI